MFGIPGTPSLGMLSVAGLEPNVRNNDQAQMTALQKLYAAAHAANSTPQGRINRGFNQFGPQPSEPVQPMLPTPPTPSPVDTSGWPALKQARAPTGPAGPVSVNGDPLPNVGPTSVGGAPLPTASPLDNAQWPAGPNGAPASLGQTPDYSGQAYNLPIGNGYQMPAFGPTGSAPDASGPDVIQKLMRFFGNKDKPSSS